MPAIALPGLVFFANALLYITLMTLLPAIAAEHGLDKAALGMALLGIPVGTGLALPIAARITDRLGARATAGAMLALIALCLPFSTAAPFAGLVALLAVFGFARAVLEVAQNLLARQVEIATGRNVLARSHGCWSLGLLAGALYGAGIARAGWDALAQQTGASLIAAPLILVLLCLGPKAATAAPVSGRWGLTLPDRPILWICAAFFGISLVEGVTYDWGMFYLGDRLSLGEAGANMVFAAFTLGMGGVRMGGDWLRRHRSPGVLLMGSFVSAFAGVALLLAAPAGVPLAAGLAAGLAMALIGAGIALIAPLSVVIVADMDNRPLADNLAALSLSNMVSIIAVPALMGHLAEAAGVGAVFWLLLPAIAASAVLVGRLTPASLRGAGTPGGEPIPGT